MIQMMIDNGMFDGWKAFFEQAPGILYEVFWAICFFVILGVVVTGVFWMAVIVIDTKLERKQLRKGCKRVRKFRDL